MSVVAPPKQVAVVAHAGKSFGGGLQELRRELSRRGYSDPLWIEVPKSRFAPPQVERALGDGTELLFVWGGDGTVQRAIDAAAGSEVPLAILPAGTANLLATNLGIPQDIGAALDVGLHGERRRLDVATFEGEHFAVMAGVGFDASMIAQADGTLKDRFGRLAYVWTGSNSLRRKPFKAKIDVDGVPWYRGEASCILIGNVGRLFGGIEVFADAEPDDGRLELGVVNADGVTDWARTLARTAVGHAERSPLVQATSAKKIKVKLNRKVLYEIDGGDRDKVSSFTVKVRPQRSRSACPTTNEEALNVSDHLESVRATKRPRAAAGAFVDSRAFAILSRAGFVARGLVYGIIGILAFDLAIGHGGKITNQQGALRTVADKPFGHLLLTLLAIGLGGYAMWRLFRAVLGRGPEGADRGLDRVGAFGSGVTYAVMCAIAVSILTSGSSGGGSAKKTASGVFAWPAGRWLVGLAGLVLLGVAVYQLVRGVGRKFLDDSDTAEMPSTLRSWFTVLGVVGHVARAVVFGLVGGFLVKASYDYKANEAIGLDGALAKLYNGAYGNVLLGIVAAGLIAFAVFALVEARYRRI